MRIVASCSACQAQFIVDAVHGGKKLKCAKCGGAVIVPGGAFVNPSPQTPSQIAPPAAPVEAAEVPPEPVAESEPDDDGLSFLTAAAPAPAPPAVSPAYTSRHQGANSSGSKGPFWIIGGSVALLLLGGGVTFLLMNNKKEPPAVQTPVEAPTRKQISLTVTLPEKDRGDIQILVDGDRDPAPFSGDYVYKKKLLKPGNHEILILRRGFENYAESLPLKAGEDRIVAPKWKSLEAAAVPAIARIDGSSDDNPPGYEGWYQDPDEALKKAAANKTDVLVAIVGSDWSADCKELQSQVFAQAEFRNRLGKQYVFCLLDFPKRHNMSKVKDAARNKRWREKLSVDADDVPVIVMLDAQGQAFGRSRFSGKLFNPYAMEEEEAVRSINTEDVIKTINSFQENRKEIKSHLDAIAAAVAGRKMSALRAALDWIVRKDLQQSYQLILKDWLLECKKLDGDNRLGQYEVFFEQSWLSRLSYPTEANRTNISGVVKELDDFEKQAKFKDDDRGAKLHMTAAFIYSMTSQNGDAKRHIEAAKKFHPKDARLADWIKRINPGDIGVTGSGSGYVVAAGGYIMTNYHVVDQAKHVKVRVPGQEDPVPAAVIATDKKIDMALIRVSGPAADKLKPLSVVSDAVRRGMPVAALGFPRGSSFGQQVKLSNGTVSALPDEANEGMLMTNVTINPGNSGGPLVDGRGAVVGMITAVTTGRNTGNSFGLAVPGNELVTFISKHVPNYKPTLPAAQSLSRDSQDWSAVDEAVSPSVLMILETE